MLVDFIMLMPMTFLALMIGAIILGFNAPKIRPRISISIARIIVGKRE